MVLANARGNVRAVEEEDARGREYVAMLEVGYRKCSPFHGDVSDSLRLIQAVKRVASFKLMLSLLKLLYYFHLNFTSILMLADAQKSISHLKIQSTTH